MPQSIKITDKKLANGPHKIINKQGIAMIMGDSGPKWIYDIGYLKKNKIQTNYFIQNMIAIRGRYQ